MEVFNSLPKTFNGVVNGHQTSILRGGKPNYIAYDKAQFYLDSRYQLNEVLGKGSYGTVASAVDTKSSDNGLLAIKKVSSIFNVEILMKRAVRELKLMRFFKGHRNIVNLIDVDIVFIKPFEGLYCFQELIDYDLARVIHSHVQFSEFHIQNFVYQILCGLKYIHSAEVIHRDLKPGNILITVQGTLKICDFGLARGISPKFITKTRSRANNITSYVATRWYRAPELILSRNRYSKSVDLWAVGCILAEFYGRRPLFVADDQLHQVMEIMKVLGTPPRCVISDYGNLTDVSFNVFAPPRPQYSPIPWKHIYPYACEDAHDLLSSLLCWDVSQRLTVDQCLTHEYFGDVKDRFKEISSVEQFDFSFESNFVNIHDLKNLLVDEIKQFKRENSTQCKLFEQTEI